MMFLHLTKARLTDYSGKEMQRNPEKEKTLHLQSTFYNSSARLFNFIFKAAKKSLGLSTKNKIVSDLLFIPNIFVTVIDSFK